MRLRLALVAVGWPALAAHACPSPWPQEAPAEAAADGLDGALERARGALFGRGAQTLVETSGTVDLATGPAPFRWIFAPDGAFLLETKGRAASSLRSEGGTVWRSDLNGPTWVAGGLEAERAKALAWVWSGAWAKERGPLELEVLEDSMRGDVVLGLGLPDGALEAALVLDGESGRPEELRFGPEFGGERFRFSAWRDAGELWLPGEVRLLESDGTQRTFEVADVRPWTRHAPPFGRPERPIQSFNVADFRKGAAPEVGAAVDERGVLLVDALINGLPTRFELDPSCGASEIDRLVADSLRLSRSHGGQRLAFDEEAPGDGVLRASGRALVVGPFARSFPMFREVEGLEEWTAQSRAGRLGWDVLSRAVAEIDRGEPSVALHPPATWTSPEDAGWADLAFHWTTPHVRARLDDGREAWLRLVAFGEPTVLYADALPVLAAAPESSTDAGEAAPEDGQPGAPGEPADGEASGGEASDGVAEGDDAPSSTDDDAPRLRVAGRVIDARVVPTPPGTLHRYTHGEVALDALGERWILDFPGARLGVPRAD